ncbi:hypothetical protein Nm8I071_39040 [Nonomuraea sp. TT08I-71]|nr:hypothetical protein Nm8I071_39040 [Nonomuraea sp. TT08I-71]
MGWSAAEAALGIELPGDYKRLADAYGPGLIDDHLIICAPGAATGWTDLLDNNVMAQGSCRIWFGGVDDGPVSQAEDLWPLGDSSRWHGNDVPDWFQSGDDLVSWGGTGNSDLLRDGCEPQPMVPSILSVRSRMSGTASSTVTSTKALSRPYRRRYSA